MVKPAIDLSQFNNATPLVMHVDLNSCFASIEQQARPKLRGRPVVIVNRACSKTSIITASYEAKNLGVKTLMKLSDAKRIIPNLIAIESDPAKYRFVYRKILNIRESYSAHVTMKSIDEGVIDFNQTTNLIKKVGLENIAYEIKNRLSTEVGVAMRCNIGIGTNRFLAKTAASLHKPNGLDIITSQNLHSIFKNLKLTDLTGIANKNQARLNAVNIFTPLDFLNTNEEILRLVVFKSIEGTKWHQRLRGFEVDDVTSEISRVGRQYVLESFSLNQYQILQRLHHLCESVGWRKQIIHIILFGTILNFLLHLFVVIRLFSLLLKNFFLQHHKTLKKLAFTATNFLTIVATNWFYSQTNYYKKKLFLWQPIK